MTTPPFTRPKFRLSLKLGSLEKEIDIGQLPKPEQSIFLRFLGVRQEADEILDRLAGPRERFKNLGYNEVRRLCDMRGTCTKTCAFIVTTMRLPDVVFKPYQECWPDVKVTAKKHTATAACDVACNTLSRNSLILTVKVHGFSMSRYYKLEEK